MKHVLPGLFGALLLAGCSQLESIPYTPTQTAETWLRIQPWAELRIAGSSLILVQPSTSAIVYLLGFITMGAGLYFLRIREGQKSRLWWGIALLLWGLGALFAGTSYEAFSYQIKCAGREACIWTSGWEIWYLLFSVASVNAMVVAQAYCCTSGKRRKTLTLYALINMSVYAITVLIGTIVPVKFLISFELLILFAAPSIIILILVNGWRYSRLRQRSDVYFQITWGWLALTIGAYFLYYLSGMTQMLWAQGFWFSENDVLHLGLIAWMLFIALALAPQIRDE